MSTSLQKAAAAYKRAQAIAEERRKELAAAIVEADAAGTRQVDIVAVTGYTREHVRRILRDAQS